MIGNNQHQTQAKICPSKMETKTKPQTLHEVKLRVIQKRLDAMPESSLGEIGETLGITHNALYKWILRYKLKWNGQRFYDKKYPKNYYRITPKK